MIGSASDIVGVWIEPVIAQVKALNADRSVNQNENISRCFSCHKSREQQDFVFTFEQMKSVK